MPSGQQRKQVQLGPPNNNPTLLKLIKHLKKMKNTTYMLVAIAMSLGSMTFAQDQAPIGGGFAPDANPNVKPAHGTVQHGGEQPKPEVGGPLIHPLPPAPLTFEQWIHEGKKIPSGLVFTGGSPRFDESTGKDRSDEEVYKIIFPNHGEKPDAEKPDHAVKPDAEKPDHAVTPDAEKPNHGEKPDAEKPDHGEKPEVEKPEDPVAEYRGLEAGIADMKKIAKGLPNGLTKKGEDALASFEARLAELKKIPEVAICIFPPRPEPRPFPLHWGRPPLAQTKDLRPLPGDFGHGSSTLAAWIESNIKSDHSNKDKPKPEPKRPPVVRPLTPPRPEISQDTKDDLAKIGKDKSDLFRAMREELGKLEKDSSMADVRKAVDEFKKENADKFAAIKEAADKVHEELKAKRPERKVRPEPPAAVKAKIAEVKKVEKTLHVARKAVSDKLKEAQDELTAKIVEAKENADKEEVAINIKRLVAEQAAARKAALDEFRAAQKEKHKELKAAQKELRKEVRDTKEEGSSRSSR
jgi:hypothetical protein